MKRLKLRDLLAKGYFPRELPPPFNSRLFADAVAKRRALLPVEFTKDKDTWCAFTSYSLARPGSLRRRIAILNPLAYYRLSTVVVANQDRLFRLAARSAIAISTPTVSSSDAMAIACAASPSEFPWVRAQRRVAKCYALTADVSRFYPSVYTHALDWAIEGKAKAKASLRSKKHLSLGKRIDKLVQAGQEGQTRGIPIGPDISVLLAHILLGAVDKRLDRDGFAMGTRFMDDYELVFESRSDAEGALAALEEALAEYELELNPQKTGIEALPMSMEDEAIQELRAFPIRTTSQGQRFDLLHYFNRAFTLAKQKPARPILRYAVGRLRRLKMARGCCELLQELVLQAASVEPGVWPKAIPCIQRLRVTNPGVDKDPIARVVDMVVRQQSPRAHSSEVAWSLWAAIVFELNISKETAKAVLTMEDDVCALLLLHARTLNLVQQGIRWQELGRYLIPSELQGRHWLLAYEAEKKGWLTPNTGSVISQNSVFEFLRKRGVEFYNTLAIPASPKPVAKAEGPPIPEGEYEGDVILEFEEDAADTGYS